MGLNEHGTMVPNENISFKQDKAKEACPCCGALSLEERGIWDICPVCHWEDEGLGDGSMANGMPLIVAKAIYATTQYRLRGIVEFPHDDIKFDPIAQQRICEQLNLLRPLADQLDVIAPAYKKICVEYHTCCGHEPEGFFDKMFDLERDFNRALAGYIMVNGKLPERDWLRECATAGYDDEPTE